MYLKFEKWNYTLFLMAVCLPFPSHSPSYTHFTSYGYYLINSFNLIFKFHVWRLCPKECMHWIKGFFVKQKVISLYIECKENEFFLQMLSTFGINSMKNFFKKSKNSNEIILLQFYLIISGHQLGDLSSVHLKWMDRLKLNLDWNTCHNRI